MDNVLFIDGRNTAYRAVFAARGGRGNRHPFAVWMCLAHPWFEKFKPSSVHVFWDCPRRDIWRKRVLHEYKDHRHDMPCYRDDVQGDLKRFTLAASDMFKFMGVRQYLRSKQECDDLIYTACRVLTPPRSDMTKIIVISSDSDFQQLQWSMSHVALYLPKKNKFAEQPNCDPAIQKALCGDTSDNVKGFYGIGPVKGQKLAIDSKKLTEFLESIDASERAKFKRNISLIDLSVNPAYINNRIYVVKKMAQDVDFNKAKINNLAMKHKVHGFTQEFEKSAHIFKRLV